MAARRFLRRLGAASLGMGLLVAGAAAQTYPTRPVVLVVPFPAGSTTDLVGRIAGNELSKRLGQPVVIDNRGGAGGIVGAEYVAHATPDGYTLLMGTIGTHGIVPGLYSKIPYDPIGDFSPIAEFGIAPNVLVVNPKLPVNTLRALIDYAKARPGQVNFGSSGNGTSPHLSGVLLGTKAGIEIVHVPYRGGAQAITDLLSGEVSFMFYHYLALLPHINAGTMRPLAVTSATRIDALPDVPTMGEAGVADFDVSAWFAIYAPARLPAPLVAKLSGTVADIMRAPDVRKLLIGQGVAPVTDTPDELAAFTKSEIARWARVIELSGARVD
jgi:tripartite-type tricarboxylate transporter receptor subunit TctC